MERFHSNTFLLLKTTYWPIKWYFCWVGMVLDHENHLTAHLETYWSVKKIRKKKSVLFKQFTWGTCCSLSRQTLSLQENISAGSTGYWRNSAYLPPVFSELSLWWCRKGGSQNLTGCLCRWFCSCPWALKTCSAPNNQTNQQPTYSPFSTFTLMKCSGWGR